MNKEQAENLLLQAVNAQEVKYKEEVNANPASVEQYKGYGWSLEPQLADELDWHELGIDDVEFGRFRVELVEEFGGEGQGDHVHMVFKFTLPEGVEYWKKDGYYASHYGTEWDGDFYQVNPVVKTITVYE